MDIGKEKGYLLYDEVSDLLPPEISASAEDLDDLFSAFGTAGIEVIDTDDQSFAGLDKVAGAKKFEEQPEDIELDLTPGALEKTNDPVRMYLREMGTVPLLTRDGEVEIAKRIERGQMTVLKSLSRSAVIVREIIALGDQLMTDPSIIKDILQFSDEELTDEKIEEKHQETLEIIEQINKTYKKVSQLRAKLETVPKTKKGPYRRAYWNLARTRVKLSELVRSLEFSTSEKLRLVGLMKGTVEKMPPLEQELSRLERKADHTKKEYRKAIPKDIRQAITRGIADQARTIRIPVHMIETINKLIRTSRALVQELGREPTSEEIAKRMDIPVSKVRKVLKIAQEPISLETPIGEEEDSHLGDFIEDRGVVSPADAVININLKEMTEQVLNTLTPREERVIKMRFGLEDGTEHTLEEVGQNFAVTRERIRQIEAKALRKLRHPSRSRRLRAFLDGTGRD